MTGDLRLLRALLAALAVGPLLVGVTALAAPHAFYDNFPFVASWVRLLPPYNQHLVTDVGGLQLAFGGLLAYAAARPHPALVEPVAAAWALSQAFHLLFHLTHLDGFGTVDAIGQAVSLALFVLVPMWVIALSRNRRPAPATAAAAR